MKNKSLKQKIIDSAIYLFNTKGYDGTSVRQIAEHAKCNVAGISYYFSNKEGLLEELVSSYLEGYLSIIEFAYSELDKRSARECLLLVTRNIMIYQKDHRHLSRFVLREITRDTTLIREVMTTYLTKEKYYLQAILEKGQKQQEFKRLPNSYVIMQLKGLLTMPYLYPQYLSEVLHIMPYESYVTDQYCREVEKWINLYICTTSISSENDDKLIHLPVNL